MPNIIQLHLLNNKTIVPKINGQPYAIEGGYRIIAGEVNATVFEIASVPAQYQNAVYSICLTNSKGYDVTPPTIVNNQFALPVGMAIAGYGQIIFKAAMDNETIIWFPLKIKVWNTEPNWKIFAKTPETITIGNVTTLSSESEAFVTNIGTDKLAILNFGIPKGKDGANGIEGKSAYEIAVKNGFGGTEEEWLESLKADIDLSDYVTKSEHDESLEGKANIDGNYPDMTVGTALNALNAMSAVNAINDGDGKNISSTYLKISDLLGKTYPVGSIYLSTVSTSPASIYGGTWSQIKDVFLLAAGDTYSAGSTGGSADAVVVEHTHRGNGVNEDTPVSGGDFIAMGRRCTDTTSGNVELKELLGTTGESGTGKNMPPYLAVYAWKRIA